MKNTKDKKLAFITRILSVLGACLIWTFCIYISNTTGFIGLLKWEVVAIISFIAIILSGLIALGLGLFKSKLIKKISIGFSAFIIVVALIANVLVFSFGLHQSKKPFQLNFYSSSSAPLKEDKNLKLAVASDGHWGATTANGEARNQILDYVNKNNYDLFIISGDIVELGFMSSHYQSAKEDLEKYLTTVPVSFVMGNHDALVNSTLTFRKHLQPNESSFNYVLNPAKDVYIVVFNLLWDMSGVSSKDVEWLKTTLSKFSQSDTVIFQTHCFAYGSGKVSGGGGKWFDNQEVINSIVPILESNNVDVMVSGHQHSMELMEKNGIHYLLVGPLGGSLYGDYEFNTVANQIYYNGEVHGFTEIEIAGEKMEITFKNYLGENLFSKEINT